jgi:hypothetical protein
VIIKPAIKYANPLVKNPPLRGRIFLKIPLCSADNSISEKAGSLAARCRSPSEKV